MDSNSPIRHQIDAIESRPWARRALRLGVRLLTVGYFAFALLVLVLRYGILPNIEHYRGDLQQVLSSALHRPVAIDRIEATWQGLRPELDLYGLRIQDAAGRTALSLEHVDAVLGWTSLVYLRPRFHQLEIIAPDLAVRRDKDGHLFVAGLLVDQSPDTSGGEGFGDWLLDQAEIVVDDAKVTWTDELRAAPPLAMAHLNFRLDNSYHHHRFGLNFEPPQNIAGRVDFRGDLKGLSLNDRDSWHGELYAQVGYIDLAVWRTWVDYPLALPQGHGALRVWMDVAKFRPTGLTADVALADTQIRLDKDLKILDLVRIDGRVAGRILDDGFESSVSHLSLATHEGLRLNPVDASLRWRTHEGEFDATMLDLSTLNQLSAYLPLPPEIRKPLAEYAPGGRISGLQLGWSGKTRDFEHFHIAANFQNLRLDPQGDVPGFSGISGKLAGDESGGEIDISSRDALLNMPAVFSEPRISFAALTLQGGWRRRGADNEFSITQAEFRNPDLEGGASGNFRWRDGGPNVIDLNANLSRADATAVARYLPKKVDPDAVAWLKRSILGGMVNGVTAKIQGDLDHFPFGDKSGTFHIAANIRGTTLRFAPEWPQINDINGTLVFEGPRILINATQGRIMDVTLPSVKAELPDIDHAENVSVTGRAVGQTDSFLKYIEASPIGKNIDHATAHMSATGSGELDIKLDIPVRHADDTRVSGDYRFDGDHLVPEPGLPELDDVHGRLVFTNSDFSVKAAQMHILGAPARVDVKTQPDGTVVVTAGGDLVMTQLRQHVPHPLFDHVNGATRWNGTLKIKKGFVDAHIASTLQGLSSSLPYPFNKAAGDSMPLVFEHKLPEAQRPGSRRARELANFSDQMDVTLGKALRLRIQHHAPAASGIVDRGIIAVGDASPKWPDKGVVLSAGWDHFDYDFWLPIINAKVGDGSGDLGITQFDVHAGEGVMFNRLVHDVRVSGTHQAPAWSFDVKCHEVVGDHFVWTEGEPAQLSGHISQFNPPDPVPGTAATAGDTMQQLPNLDLTFDRFVLRGMDFGGLKIKAENKGGDWDAQIDVKNEAFEVNAGHARWHPDPHTPDTHLDFKLKARSIEKTLDRLGYPNTVKDGRASFEGSLSWNGPPYDIDFPTLDGSLTLNAEKGQFRKIEPGVGRLLGLFSMQSLLRRFSFDFRDVFSEGFAFDSITGTGKVTRGVIDTSDVVINGPAAKVQMAGTIDLAKATQDLKVRVQTSLSNTVVTGVVILNPAVGAGAWLFNKVFGSPLDKAFAYDLAVTGDWANPKVDKIGVQAGAAAKQESDQ